jgi:hypothetical protein
VVRIAITEAAFDAITKTLPLGSAGYENEVNEKGERLIRLDQGGCRPAAPSPRPGRELLGRDPAAGGERLTSLFDKCRIYHDM